VPQIGAPWGTAVFRNRQRTRATCLYVTHGEGIITHMRQMQENTVLPVAPGLCGECRHASVKGTNRGHVYLRCTRAAWDDRLVRYPSLPMTDCVGFEPGGHAEEQSHEAQPSVPGPRQADEPRLGPA